MGIIMTGKQLRPRDPLDHYPTPVELCRAAVATLPDHPAPLVLDPGSGTGVWGRAVRERYIFSRIHGSEIDGSLTGTKDYDAWFTGDYLTQPLQGDYDLIVGNPPYKFAKQFVERSLDLLRWDGMLLFLLRLAFMEAQSRHHWWTEHRPSCVSVLSRRPSFTGDRKTDATAYAIYTWPKDYQGKTELNWLWWDYEEAK